MQQLMNKGHLDLILAYSVLLKTLERLRNEMYLYCSRFLLTPAGDVVDSAEFITE